MSYERNIQRASTVQQVNREREAARRAFQAKRITQQEYSQVIRAAGQWRKQTKSSWWS